MHPKLYNHSGELKAVLDNIIDDTASIKRVVNGEFTFTFDAYEKELKSEYFDPDNYLVIDGQAFDIKYIQQNHETEVKYNIQCEHVNYRLEDGEENQYVSYANIGTPAQILTGMLFGTGFSVGTVEFTDEIAISVNTQISKKALIYKLVNLLGGEVEYTGLGFTINILNSIGQNNGFQARFGKNLKGISKTIDSRGGLKTYYEVEIVELKNSNEYIEKGLQGLEVIGVGDAIRIIDSVIGLVVDNRVLSIQYNPILAINTKLEIANTIEFITDTINQIERSSVKQDVLYNNVAISQEYGFRAVRSDLLARATLGGGTISLDTGDGTGEYTPALYFDAVTGKYRVIGDIIMESGSISWNDVEPPSAEDVGAISDTYIDSQGVFTPNVYATNISALNGKMDSAIIEDLIVGDNVTMGENAYIAWGKVTDAPDIESVALDAIEDTYIDSYGVWTPYVHATKISTLLGKIETALIDDLIVGENVTMGANASISWVNVSGKPDIPLPYTDAEALAAWEASNYATHMDSQGVYTGNIIGYQSLGIGAYTWVACPFRVDTSGNMTAYNADISGNINMTDGYISIASSVEVGNAITIGNGGLAGIKSLNFLNTSSSMAEISFNDSGQMFIDNYGSITVSTGNTLALNPNNLSILSGDFYAELSGNVTFNGMQGFSVDCPRFGVFGTTPVVQQDAQRLGSLATTETADATYSSNEQTMLNNIKQDLLDIKNKMNGTLNKLGYYGWFYVYD